MKHILRKKFVEKRNKLNPEFIEIKSRIIKNKLLKIKEVKNANKVAVYYSKGNEVLTEEIILFFLKMNKRVFLPKIKGKELEFKEINKFKDLEKGAFGIKEPKNHCLIINPNELDLLIIPCVAVDEQRNRIGRGGGFYDRFLAKNKFVKTICLAYDFQILKNIPIEKNDQKIDLIITDKRIIKKESRILDGKKLADKILLKLKKKIKNKKIKATLAVILVGSDVASETYVKKKAKKCEEIGIKFELIRFKENISEKEIKLKIRELNQKKEINGILVQLPLPKNLNTNKIINTILPEKDVDGLTKVNRRKLGKEDESIACCTPKGIIRLLEEYNINLNNKRIVLVGYGYLVGEPLSLMLNNRKLKFVVCDDQTKNLKEKTRKADILITATGVPHLIKKEFVKEESVIIDAGISKLNKKIVGDIDFENVKDKVNYITPVPGGVGVMTIAMLIENVLKAYEFQHNLK